MRLCLCFRFICVQLFPSSWIFFVFVPDHYSLILCCPLDILHLVEEGKDKGPRGQLPVGMSEAHQETGEIHLCWLLVAASPPHVKIPLPLSIPFIRTKSRILVTMSTMLANSKNVYSGSSRDTGRSFSQL